MDMPADFALKATLPPSSGKGAAMSISVMPGYQSGQRLASLKSAMVSCGEALIWTLRCTIAIVDLPALCCVSLCHREAAVESAASEPDRPNVKSPRSPRAVPSRVEVYIPPPCCFARKSRRLHLTRLTAAPD